MTPNFVTSKDRPQFCRAEPSMVNLSLGGKIEFRTSRTTVARTLYIFLAVAAFFDFCATVMADFVPEKQEEEFITVKRRTRHQVVIESNDWLVFDFLKFLDVWYVHIGISFSLFWFLCAFIKAQWARDKKLQELDRKRLLGEENVLGVKAFESDVKAFEGAWDAYYWTVGIQLLLLPVGFYFFFWNILRRILNASAEIHNDNVEVDVIYTGEYGTMKVEHRFTTHSTHCLLRAILHYCAVVIKQMTGVQLEYSADIIKKKVMRHVLGFALRHPKRFVRRLRRAQTGIRWCKYLAPLIGTGNKLLGNVKDLLTKQKQYMSARRARRIRKQFWKLMSEDERREAAAIRIQKCYRAVRARKAMNALQLIKGTKESIAAIRMQAAFRGALVAASKDNSLVERTRASSSGRTSRCDRKIFCLTHEC